MASLMTFTTTKKVDTTNKFKKMCIWKGIGLYNKKPEEFEAWFASIGYRVKFKQYIINSGGGRDLLFYVHDDDLDKFQLSQSMQWFKI